MAFGRITPDYRSEIVLQFASLVLLVLMTTVFMPTPAWTAPVLTGTQIEGSQHRGPRAYHAMCARAPQLCMHDRRAGRVRGIGPAASLDTARWQQMVFVNDDVNARVRPEDDQHLYGQSDFWTRPSHAGDCEDYMIAKKQQLIAAGWSADQLLYAVVEGKETPYHAVLVVRTDRGDFVLDNLHTDVRRWDQTGYRFVIRQSAHDPYTWVRLIDPSDAVAGLPTPTIVATR